MSQVKLVFKEGEEGEEGPEMEVFANQDNEITLRIYMNEHRDIHFSGQISLDEYATRILIKELQKALKEIKS